MLLIRGRDAAEAAMLAAGQLAQACAEACAARGRAVIAVSGGETPWLMLAGFARQTLPWSVVYLTQVDERIARADDPRRNLARLRRIMVEDGPLPEWNLLPLPVQALYEGPSGASAAAAATEDYLAALARLTGQPPVLDVVQLGLGADGHTASLLPGDVLLEEHERDLGRSEVYQGLPRLTMTYPLLRRARKVLWLVTGEAKRQPLHGLLEGHGDSPAVRLGRTDATVVADAAATSEPGPIG
jgi:6-phosphogluconolactonase